MTTDKLKDILNDRFNSPNYFSIDDMVEGKSIVMDKLVDMLNDRFNSPYHLSVYVINESRPIFIDKLVDMLNDRFNSPNHLSVNVMVEGKYMMSVEYSIGQFTCLSPTCMELWSKIGARLWTLGMAKFKSLLDFVKIVTHCHNMLEKGSN